MHDPSGGPSGQAQHPGSFSETSPKNPSNAASPRTLPAVRLPTSSYEPPARGPTLPPPTLPPLVRSRSETPGDGVSDLGSRSSFVHSILNPSQERSEESQQSSRLGSPNSSQTTSPNALRSLISRPSSTDTSHGAESPRRAQFARDPLHRQLLGSGSPRLSRAVSMGRLPQSSGSVEGLHQFVHEGNRRMVVETGGAGVPSLSNPSAQRPAGFVSDSSSKPSFLQGSPAHLHQHHNQHPQQQHEHRRASGGLPPIESASPRPRFASHSHSAQASPAQPFATPAGPIPTSSYPSTPSAARNQPSPTPPAVSFEAERHYGGAAHTGQSVIQMMAVETGQGIVQVPVDVQAASRVADEKRKRNAGASARFRQRRKEKEMQASNMISRLERDLQDARDDADFYKRERDTLANILLHIPGYERHFPRPQSPRHHRRHSTQRQPGSPGTQAGSTNSSSGAYSVMSDRSPPPLESDRSKRRRTSGYSLPPITTANTSTAGGPSAYAPAPTYSSLVPHPPPQPHSGGHMPGHEYQNAAPGQQAALPALHPTHQQRHPEHFRDEQQQYERNWPERSNASDRRPT